MTGIVDFRTVLEDPEGESITPANPLPVSIDGSSITPTSPIAVAVYGELLEAVEALRMATQSLTRTVGMAMPDTAGRLRVNVEAGTITAVISSGSITTVGNQTNMGGFSGTEQIPSLMRLGADSLRRNIIVS